ncbi:Nuclear Hormone Receptor family [Caenorhabditis elegans]|uniref:Nuclear Hormone Receptor family n=1 Tax=Caenorhabditis elegans TaxID=6239 RepID=O01564_CAEEL|nr:Nuclear Hormone Receptor family [Caenorhabditis elegans]CCD64886.1 Nuclear Hormone Receptor family [Caenorhabditis elegans]|eukprot:NP_504066.1 Nuclear Hormone Receptor family [Caenorhabditis elegans]
MGSDYSEASSSSSPEMFALNLTGQKACVVCKRPANCYNFGVMSCDACKMFFRRTMLLNVQYVCRRKNQCFDDSFSCLKTPYCRACRLVQCVKVGMKLNLSAMLEVKNQKDDAVATLIESLLYQDARREKNLMTHFTYENPTLEDIIESRQLTLVVRDPSHEMTSSDWCFFGAYTAVKFLLGLGFMKKLSTRDKSLLLANYSAKATLLFSAIRTMRAKNDKMIKPDGKDFFVEFLSQWSDFSLHYTNRIRSLLVNRLIELNITNEEFILITVLFFCNPALDDLSESAVAVLTEQQKAYGSALMQYCKLSYQHNGSSRFTELLSLCTVTNKYYEDVQYLYWIFQFHFHVKYKNLVSVII